MARAPEYQFFLDSIQGRVADTLPRDLETIATPQEIGWWKREQMRRAIHNLRLGEALQKSADI